MHRKSLLIKNPTGSSRMCFALNTKPILMICSARPKVERVGGYDSELDHVSRLLGVRYRTQCFLGLAKTIAQGEAVKGTAGRTA